MKLQNRKIRSILEEINIFSFADYRALLAAYYQAAKARDERYSYVHLSEDLGVGSTNAFAIIQGQRNLSVKSAERIAERFNLSAKEKKYLVALVKQANARSVPQREAAFREQVEIVRRMLPSDMDKRRLAFFEHWYHAAILELLRLDNASDQPEWISTHLYPNISPHKARESLELLKSLAYVAFDQARGRLYPTELTVTTGLDVQRLAIVSYHRQMIELAVQAMDAVPAEEREISAITLSVSADLQQQLIEELRALRRKYMDLANRETSADNILQVNMQLFPLSKLRDKK